MKTLEDLEMEFAKVKEVAEKWEKDIEPKLVSFIGAVINAAFLQYTIGMVQQRESNEERVTKELFGDGSGEALPELSQEERDSDGWIEWNGVGRPHILAREKIEARFANGDIANGEADQYRWDHVGSSDDVIAYRISK